MLQNWSNTYFLFKKKKKNQKQSKTKNRVSWITNEYLNTTNVYSIIIYDCTQVHRSFLDACACVWKRFILMFILQNQPVLLLVVQRQMTAVPCWQRCLSTAAEVWGLWKQNFHTFPCTPRWSLWTNTFSHSHFFTDLLVFFKCMPAYNYLNSFIIAALTNSRETYQGEKKNSVGQGNSTCGLLAPGKL